MDSKTCSGSYKNYVFIDKRTTIETEPVQITQIILTFIFSVDLVPVTIKILVNLAELFRLLDSRAKVFLFIVHSLMSSQFAGIDERLSAHAARVRFFPCMNRSVEKWWRIYRYKNLYSFNERQRKFTLCDTWACWRVWNFCRTRCTQMVSYPREPVHVIANSLRSGSSCHIVDI